MWSCSEDETQQGWRVDGRQGMSAGVSSLNGFICAVVPLKYYSFTTPCGLWVVRIDPLCFVAGCCKRRLNQALSVLSLSLGFF